MEKKIKSLYILSILAILAFLGMQAYWLYTRYEYSVSEYEDATFTLISDALAEYNNHRASYATSINEVRVMSRYNMNHNVDSSGNSKRTVTVRTREMNGRKILGITENRKLTPDELKRLEKIVIDSLEMAEEKMATVDASSAPTDGVAWNAMKNFENEILSPFTIEGIDSALRKYDIAAEVSLILQDSVTWEPVTLRHTSLLYPRLKVIAPYSELERKAVEIVHSIPSSEILRAMGGTLAVALLLSIFLIACLVWQIKTIVRLTRLDKMRNMFITTMIHELKRPISTLKMCVSGIESDRLMADLKLRKELTGESRSALDNLSAYFSRLRDITFNNVDEIPLNVTSFNLSSLADTVLRSVSIPSTKQVDLENVIPADMQISADRSHLSNILTNLVENAIKYSSDAVTVKIRAEIVDNGVMMTVADNGNGILSSDMPKIFNRFYRGKASGPDIPGMGLGLTYVKLLIEAHCGEISVESRPGAGSKFTIKLPQ